MHAARLIALLLSLSLSCATVAQSAWPEPDWIEAPAAPALAQHVAGAFAGDAAPPLSGVRALLVVQGGRIIVERYRSGFDAKHKFISWSMGKSFAHALAGIMVREGRLALDEPLPVPEWRRQANDPRAAITLDQALRMSTGLAFNEDYESLADSDAIRMLFGSAAGDMGAYAASRPLLHAPGTHWNYSSGTTNIISRVLRDLAGGSEEAYRRFIDSELLRPIGIDDAVLEFDAAGTLIASSLLFMSARDYARFGLLYLRDGQWNGRQLLPQGWVAHARAATPGSGGRYGAHWWLSAYAGADRARVALHEFPPDTFMAQGFQEQSIIIVPSHDLLIVCLSLISDEDVSQLKDYLARIVALLPPA
jgi:CubicO group peptidase (beta-lactamase class C family)